MKNLTWFIIALGALALVSLIGWYNLRIPPQQTNTPEASQENSGVVCIQVITPARHTTTGEIKEFPTPCDVPEDWEVIQNDLPGVDLILEDN